MSKSLGITINRYSYTPEAYAYKEYLTRRGVDVQLDEACMLDPAHDVHIYFMGVLPVWRKKGEWKEIHEYQSLSTPKFSRLKDFFKKNINREPDGRIFLNGSVKDKLGFKDAKPYIYRDMGVDDALFQKPNLSPSFDIVYCGSINGRVGLVEEIKRLADLGFSILVIGAVSIEIRDFLESGGRKVAFTGRVDRKDIPELYRQCRTGLNYTPDLFPYNMQTSTKSLEYLASGLQVLSNRYQWSSWFSNEFPGCVIWLDSIREYRSLGTMSSKNEKIENYRWGNILDRSGFYDFVLQGV
ncbi:glycosyltransferase family protein [Stutzerimonas nitrititolerans]|uniref:glycosyltransferase family protein n=1 Tax=Stutzerimonas nitrititolerans TaxID=2482751 RepID=UPI0028AB3F92|nr:hypothetical protein [Stutzerimonas nitrititolerans]